MSPPRARDPRQRQQRDVQALPRLSRGHRDLRRTFVAPCLRLRPDEAAGGDEGETDRTGAEEGRHRSTQAKEVKAMAFPTYVLLAAAALIIKVVSRWALF